MNFRKSRARSRKNSMSVIVATTEKWKKYRRLSRPNSYGDDDTDDDDPMYREIKDWVDDFFERKSECDDNDQDVEVKLSKKQSLILSTLVPDEILLMDNFDTSNPKRFVGVLLMADVSGYTALSERYNNTGKGGTYRLTVTLNTYLGALIELIYSHGGDILKFAGDAFLALWKTDKRTFLCHTIHNVIACALIIQHSYASYETDVKVNLKVKLAISAGNLLFAPIGSGIDMSYVILGLPVIEAKAAESVCASGEVKLTATAWDHCYSRNYDHIVHEDGHVTIKSILYDPRDKDVSKPFSGFGPMISQIKKPLSAIDNNLDFLWSPNNLNLADSIRRNEALSLRRAILDTEEKNIGSEIRKFMIRPVLTQVDAHQPIEYLTEMRQVSILFMTLKPKECAFLQLITIVNNSYQITCEIVYKSMGCVNKIILFDKDIMILVIFGLRGFKHESEAQAALKCAYSIKKSVSALDGVQEVSIGVTTGQVYCGVVGHPLRREFTVIGAIVNKAARLMCGFRNKITCDESTFVKSKMSSNGFTLQPSIELKGIGQSGKIYEYSEEIRVKAMYDIPMTPPLLDRLDEMEYFENWLDDSHLSYRDFDALLLVGDSRIGKSRLLEWMARHTRNRGLKVCCVHLTSIHSATPYLALSQIFNQLLGIQEPVKGFIKEEKVVQMLSVYSEDLCYLNQLIKVRFAYHEGANLLDEKDRMEKAKQIFTKVIMSIQETHVIFIDDLQNLDSFSWEFICIFFKTLKIFTVVTVARGKFSSLQNWLYSVFIDGSVRKIVLGPLSSSWIVPLACQILDVKAVPNDLCNALRLKCNGVPGLIENFIVHLFSNGALEIIKIQEDNLEHWEHEDLQFPDPVLLQPQALDVKDQSALDEHILNDLTKEIGICVVVEKEQLKTNINVQNIEALVMIQIDSLTPYQQLLLKIASVIGNTLSRDLLENIMYENDPLTTAKAIKRLFAMRMLSCANLKFTKWNKKRGQSTGTLTSTVSENFNLDCDCSFEYDAEQSENLPKYAFCKVMKFRSKNTRKACYELLPLNQKKEFHSRIVHYLENIVQKCSSCGGTVMVVQSLTNLLTEEKENRRLKTLLSNDQGSSSDSSAESIVSSVGTVRESIASNAERTSDVRNTRSESINPNHELPSSSLRTNSATVAKTDNQSAGLLDKHNQRYTSILRTKNVDEVDFSRRANKRVTMSNLYFKQVDSNEIINKVFDMLRSVMEAKYISDWHSLGVVDSSDDQNIEENKRNVFSIQIEKGVSQTDVQLCNCSELNIVITEQLIHHAQQAELKSKAVEFILKYCQLNMLNNYFESILPKLDDAEEICTDQHIPENILSKFDRRRFLGKIHSLRAATFLMTEKLTAAKYEIEHATRVYGINLDKVHEFFKLSKLITSLSIKRKNQRTNSMILKSDSIFCLNVATILHATLENHQMSRISAFRALELVQTVECNVIDMCDAFSNAIQVELDRDAVDSTADVERLASKALSQLRRPIQVEELFAVGKFFMAVFRARLARAQLGATVRAGFRAITISRFLQADTISLEIIPDLFYALIAKCRIEEAIDVLQLALRLGQYNVSHDSETWYYALCMDMILDAGFQLETPQEISRYAEYALNRGKAAGASRRRLVIGLWTYWLRANCERKSRRFESEALSWAQQDDDGSMINLLSSLRLADGMLESLAGKVDDLRKVVDLMELRSIADRELTKLEGDARVLRLMYPRWLLLKGNSLQLSGRTTAAYTAFNQAFEEARRINNRLEESLARAAISNSKFWSQNARASCFPSWQGAAEQARSSWHQLQYRITTTRQ